MKNTSMLLNALEVLEHFDRFPAHFDVLNSDHSKYLLGWSHRRRWAVRDVFRKQRTVIFQHRRSKVYYRVDLRDDSVRRGRNLYFLKAL